MVFGQTVRLRFDPNRQRRYTRACRLCWARDFVLLLCEEPVLTDKRIQIDVWSDYV